MNDLMQSLAASASGMTAQSARLRVVSENVANADTPGYRRKLMTFEQAHGAAGGPAEVRAGRLFLDQSELPMVHAPAHPMANADGYYEGSNVDLVIEVADAREAQRSYEANLHMFDQTRRMAGRLLDLLRR